ncbi:hypothetical protein VB005_03381 [Metarhizium brunneum]
MYPDWPSSAADLVPLPQCFGPKLKPFDFQGPQSIDFLEFLGDGLHSFVFKVEILGRIYALKLFRFEYVWGWDGIPNDFDRSDITALTTIYNYSEPFNRECRSFGRLQEAGYEELAVQCFGYLLLDQEHERAMRAKFSNIRLEFDGNVECPGYEDVRGSFPGRSGRPPPIRGIVKEFGLGVEELKTRDMKRLFRTMTQLQQLGIINLDVGDRQLIDGKICDFSTAITVPHPVTTPELNPHLYLESESLHVLQLGTFLLCMNDYWTFDDMVRLWNEEHEDQKTEISARAYPSGYGCRFDYNLRNTPSRARVYTFVDPRKQDREQKVALRRPLHEACRKLDHALIDGRLGGTLIVIHGWRPV